MNAYFEEMPKEVATADAEKVKGEVGGADEEEVKCERPRVVRAERWMSVSVTESLSGRREDQSAIDEGVGWKLNGRER
jgi:hypothetical protein